MPLGHTRRPRGRLAGRSFQEAAARNFDDPADDGAPLPRRRSGPDRGSGRASASRWTNHAPGASRLGTEVGTPQSTLGGLSDPASALQPLGASPNRRGCQQPTLKIVQQDYCPGRRGCHAGFVESRPGGISPGGQQTRTPSRDDHHVPTTAHRKRRGVPAVCGYPMRLDAGATAATRWPRAQSASQQARQGRAGSLAGRRLQSPGRVVGTTWFARRVGLPHSALP